MLTNREVATLILVLLGLAWILTRSDLRKPIPSILKTIFGRQILSVVLVYLAYAAALVFVANWLRVLDLRSLKDTIILVLVTGLPMLFAAANEKSGVVLVRRTIRRTFGVATVVLFYINLASLSIFLEVPIQAVLIFAVVSSYFGKKQGGELVKLAKVMDVLVILIGLALFIYTTVDLIQTWAQQDLGLIGEVFALTLWFPVALLPFIYLVSFYSQARLIFAMLPFSNDRQKPRLRVRAALLLGLRGSVRLAAFFQWQWRDRIGPLRSFREARDLMREYRKAIKEHPPQSGQEGAAGPKV